MNKPIIAIIGRPNVGKSAFFNFITGKRVSIVEDVPGVTRDRIYEDVDWRGKLFKFVDTGGLEINSTDSIAIQMKRQAEIAVEIADAIIFMVDAKEGMTGADKEISDLLRKVGKPVIVAVNKVDNVGDPPPDVYEFYNLGLGEFFTLSSSHGLGIGEVLDSIYDMFPDFQENQEEPDVIKVAVVGKPNAGKSSLINRLLGEDRVIVSDIPGTTREAIDTYFTEDNQLAVDKLLASGQSVVIAVLNSLAKNDKVLTSVTEDNVRFAFFGVVATLADKVDSEFDITSDECELLVSHCITYILKVLA